jgi:hypothetical protein
MSLGWDDGRMATRQSALRRGTERGRSIVHELAREAEAARLERGTSYAELGRSLRLSGAQAARICRASSPNVSLVRMSQLLAAVGLELSARAYPGGVAVRDAGHLALLDRLRGRLHPSLRWRVEVPVVELAVAGSLDPRAWDAGIDGPACTVRVDAETHVGDLQAVQRRVSLKERDGACRVVLLLAETRHHRELLRAAGPSLRAQFPVGTREALAALGAGRAPRANALVIL